MADDVLGIARLALTVDMTQYEAGIERARSRQKQMVEEAQNSTTKLTAVEQRRVNSLNRQVDTLGLTREAQIAYDIQMRTSGKVQEGLISKLKATEQALHQKQAAEEASANSSRTQAADQRRVADLQRQIAIIGKTREEQLLYDIQMRTSGKVQEELVQKLRLAEQQTRTNVKQFNEYGLSAKQTTAALRGVPAQITDIAVSLQGGQNPLTVLLQQGGQLKDMFGGIRPAMAALGSQALALVNPWTVAAAAIGTFVIAGYQAENQTKALSNSLITTGNFARLTTAELYSLAEGLDELQNTTTARGVETITAVVGTGKFVGDQIMMVATAAEQMRIGTGRAVEETIAEFSKLRDDPVRAIIDLNDKYHFLTEAQFDNIRALKESGRETEAVAEAFRLYSEAINDRTPAMLENMGLLESGWHGIKSAAAEAWDGIVSGISRADRSLKEFVDEGLPQLARFLGAFNNQTGGAGPWAAMTVMNPGIATKATVPASAPVDTATLKARDEWFKQNSQYLSDEKKLEADIRKIRAQGVQAKIGEAAIEERIAQARAKYAEAHKGRSGAGAARSLANAESAAALQVFKDQLTEEQAAIQASTRILQAQYSAKLVTTKDYYAQTRDLMAQDAAAQEKALIGQIDYLKKRNVGGKDGVNVARQLGQLEAQLAKVRSDGANALVVLGIQEESVAQKRTRAIELYRQGLDATTDALQRQTDAAIARVGMGDKEAAQAERLAEILQDGADKRRELENQRADGSIEQAEYEAKLAALQDYVDEQARITEDGYARMDAAQSNWLNGVTSAIDNWIAQTSNVAQQTSQITTNLLDGAADSLTDFAVRSENTFDEMLADIGEQIARFFMKQAIMKFLQFFAGAFGAGGGTGGVWSENTSTTGVGGIWAAKGGAFPGAAGLSKHSGTVVNQPTPFMFAKGAGIFPLARGADGKLGVKAIGGGSETGDITINMPINIAAGGSSGGDESDGQQGQAIGEFAQKMKTMTKQTIREEMMPGGSLWRAGVQAK
jgi:lambda family phage tail tape measure protein